MCWWWCWGDKGHLQLFIDLPFLGLLLFLLIDTGLVKDIVFASILEVNWIWKLCVCFISVFIQTRFFLFDTKEGTPTWRSSNWSSFLFLQFWAATLNMDLLISYLFSFFGCSMFFCVYFQILLILTWTLCRETWKATLFFHLFQKFEVRKYSQISF